MKIKIRPPVEDPQLANLAAEVNQDIQQNSTIQQLTRAQQRALDSYHQGRKISNRRLNQLQKLGALKQEFKIETNKYKKFMELKNMSDKYATRTAAEAVTDFAEHASKIAGEKFYQKLYEIGEKYFVEASLTDDQSYIYQDLIDDIEDMPGFLKDSEKSIEIAELFIKIVNQED